MIKYQLVCEYAHEFEGWFQTGAAFDAQNQDRLVSCPICDSRNVRRALMTPNLASPKRRSALNPVLTSEVKPVGPSQPLPYRSKDLEIDGGPSSMPAATAAAVSEAISQLRMIQRKIKTECRDVGHDFALEARKIHYGESEPENIYGQSTKEERDTLVDEGIDVIAMPWLPSEH